MNSQNVYIVVNLELGWDNIVGVFLEGAVTEEELEELFPESSQYVIFHKQVQTDFTNY